MFTAVHCEMMASYTADCGLAELVYAEGSTSQQLVVHLSTVFRYNAWQGTHSSLQVRLERARCLVSVKHELHFYSPALSLIHI